LFYIVFYCSCCIRASYLTDDGDRWRKPVAPPGFCNREEVRYGSIGGLEYEVPQSRLYCLCINVALCSTALQCICRVIRKRSVTMKAHTYYTIFGRPPIGGELPSSPPWRRYWRKRLKSDRARQTVSSGPGASHDFEGGKKKIVRPC